MKRSLKHALAVLAAVVLTLGMMPAAFATPPRELE